MKSSLWLREAVLLSLQASDGCDNSGTLIKSCEGGVKYISEALQQATGSLASRKPHLRIPQQSVQHDTTVDPLAIAAGSEKTVFSTWLRGLALQRLLRRSSCRQTGALRRLAVRQNAWRP